MRLRILPPLLGLALLAPALAHAQDEQPQLGLDLSDEPVQAGPDLRPRLAVMPIALPADATPQQKARFEKLQASFVALAKNRKKFASVKEPAEAATLLVEGTDAATRCTAAACAKDVAKLLSADVILFSRAVMGPQGVGIEFSGFDPGAPDLAGAKADVGPDRNNLLEKRIFAALPPLLDKLGTHLGTIKITSPVAHAEMDVDGETVGTDTDTAEAHVTRGAHKVAIRHVDYLPYEQQVTVEADKTVEVTPKFTPKPTTVSVDLSKPAQRSSWVKPGLFVAGAGAAALVAGGIFGLQARGIQARAVDADHNGVLDVTRAEVVAGQRDAKIANILFAVGGAAVAGGAVWFAVDALTAPGSGTPSSEPLAYHFGVQGTFE